jgi:hypothetical protein
VQQFDPVTNAASDYSKMYKAIYYGRHTCMFNGNDSGISASEDNGETNTNRSLNLLYYDNN